MNEFQATVGLISLLGILLALARLIQIQQRRQQELHEYMKLFAPHIAQLEQVMHMMTASMPEATEAMQALVDAMQKVGYTMEEMTKDSDLNEQQQHLKGSIRVNLIRTTEP